jgi:hypothetical protein
MVSFRATRTASGSTTITISYTDIDDNILHSNSFTCTASDNTMNTYTYYLNIGTIASGTGRKVRFTRNTTGFYFDTNSRTNAILIELPIL